MVWQAAMLASFMFGFHDLEAGGLYSFQKAETEHICRRLELE